MSSCPLLASSSPFHWLEEKLFFASVEDPFTVATKPETEAIPNPDSEFENIENDESEDEVSTEPQATLTQAEEGLFEEDTDLDESETDQAGFSKSFSTIFQK